MIDGAKAAGIMLDSGALAGGGTWVALAFGVNLAVAPDAIDQPTACLRAALPLDALTPEPLAFLAALRPRLEAWAARLDAKGSSRCAKPGSSARTGSAQQARVVLGAQIIDGRIAGLSPRGELELDTETGRRLIAAGDVFLPNAA